MRLLSYWLNIIFRVDEGNVGFIISGNFMNVGKLIFVKIIVKVMGICEEGYFLLMVGGDGITFGTLM